MRSAVILPANSATYLQRTNRQLGLVLLLACVAWLPGCGGDARKPPATDYVTGKVTLGDKQVEGMVIFHAAVGKEYSGAIGLDGTYKIENVPPGQVKIAVKGSGIAQAQPAPVTKDTPDMSKTPAKAAMGGVQPPAKYANPNNGLVYEVKGGKETYDIKLAP